MKKTNKKPKLRKYSGGGEANYNPSDPNRTTSGTGTPFTINSGQGIAAGGAALQGGIGLYNSYNNPKSTPTDNYKSARNTEGAIVSSIAPAYGILHSAVGTTVDLASSQTNAGKMDASGNLTDRTMTKQDQVGKAFADPIAMLATRGSYKGGWTDITGNAYADSLEEQAKSDIATQKSQQEQQQAQQDQYNKMVNYYNQQNPQYSKGGKHRPKLLNPKFVSPQPGSQMYGTEAFGDGGISKFKSDSTNVYDYFYNSPLNRFHSRNNVGESKGEIAGWYAATQDLQKKNPLQLSNNSIVELAKNGYIPAGSTEADKKRILSINPKAIPENEGEGWTPGNYGVMETAIQNPSKYAMGGVPCLDCGGKMYADGGEIEQYPNGGANAEVEGNEMMQAPNGSIEQAQGPSHEQGGVPVSLPAQTQILSDRLKMPGTKKTFAKLGEKYSTKKEDKLLDDENLSFVKKSTAELIKMVKNQKTQELFDTQEALKAEKVKNYAKRMGVNLEEQGETTKYSLGGTYDAHPNEIMRLQKLGYKFDLL